MMSSAQEGYQPGKPSIRGFSIVLVLLALFMAATWLLDDLIGQKAATNALRAVMCAVFITRGVQDILHPERVEDAEPRNARLMGIFILIVFTAIGTLSIQNLFFPE